MFDDPNLRADPLRMQLPYMQLGADRPHGGHLRGSSRSLGVLSFHGLMCPGGGQQDPLGLQQSRGCLVGMPGSPAGGVSNR